MKYYNLTQAKGKRMVYFRSTDIEQKNYRRLLWSVPDEWLYHLSRNKQITVIDKSTKKKGKIQRIFIPVLNDLLNGFYFQAEPKHKQLKHHLELAKILLRRDQALHIKFYFWKKYIHNPINIQAKTIRIKREKPF